MTLSQYCQRRLSDDAPAKGLRTFQGALGVPAVQLANKEGVFKRISNGAQRILVVTGHRWLSSLP
ncbi:MAG: hypothetical protein RDV41_05750 [Planctomycetota bacterium]|nr:hypothetical protein [Planctomycetota bacterium]